MRSEFNFKFELRKFEFGIGVSEVYPSIEARTVSIVTPRRITSSYEGSAEHWLLKCSTV